MLPVTQGPLDQDGAASNGLRSRKKEKTRRAIENAALDLFTEQGYEATTVDQIAERAEISKATFFRYFATKGEVIFGGEGQHHLPLKQAIIGRPSSEDDLTAVHKALQEDRAMALDPDRTARQTRAARTSPLLRGLSFDLSVKWQTTVAEAVAARRGLDAPDQRCWLVAATAFGALSSGVNFWMHEGCSGDLGAAIDHAFGLLTAICTDVRV